MVVPSTVAAATVDAGAACSPSVAAVAAVAVVGSNIITSVTTVCKRRTIRVQITNACSRDTHTLHSTTCGSVCLWRHCLAL